MALTEYRKKRDFKVTSEPRGRVTQKHKQLSFVIQKHAASHLHYDFRLELDGVLKSWAVPKGPSLDPTVKRLAMHVEDHPIEYGSFEGIIPKGQYGGGTVLLWDRGSWVPLEDPEEGYHRGSLKFVLHGDKLHGTWMLVRKGGRHGNPEERTWFLFKEKDEHAEPGSDVVTELPLSVATERDINEIADQANRIWGPQGELKQKTTRRKAETVKSHARSTTPKGTTSRNSLGRTAKKTANAETEIAGVRLSHPDKILYPEDGITKFDLAHYYEQVSHWMLPHVKNRLLTLVRCPAGSAQKCFYQKHPGEGSPEHLRRFKVKEKNGTKEYLALYDEKDLISLVHMGVLEIHLWGSQADNFEKPDRLIFDLDPDPSVAWSDVVKAARELRVLLQGFELESFLKTTGGKGLHVVLPIERRISWDDAKDFSHAVALFLEAAAPDRFTSKMSKAARKGKIFIDYLRNDRGATSIAPYSTRARSGAPVSTPITWEELGKVTSNQFTIRNLPARLARLKADPWAEIGKTKQAIKASMTKKLNSLIEQSR